MDRTGALFRPVKNNTHANPRASITPDAVYKMLIGYAKVVKIEVAGFGPHALRATAEVRAAPKPFFTNGGLTPLKTGYSYHHLQQSIFYAS
ncbi:integrase [Actimicrobium sp. GrIS 1.19]|uniref:hypothetical protein n=1 Tax=Actimicrobium sp. GrIS 1.19 TaxID=3071708 RepID=UPI002DF84004|nr:integrase [Actimicrobium sp. GrIS 1.19]